MFKHLKWICGVTAFCGSLWAGPSDAIEESMLAEYRAALVQYSKELRLTPILAPDGAEVGATYELSSSGAQFYANRSDCFPKLELQEPQAGDFLPQKLDLRSTALAAALSATFAGVFGGASFQELSLIRYVEVTRQSASRKQLLTALDIAKCPELRTALSEDIIPGPITVRKFYIIGSLYRARPLIAIGLVDAKQAGLALNGIKTKIAEMKLTVEASLSAEDTLQRTVVVTSKTPVPVFARPASIPIARFDNQLGPGSNGALIETAWEEFDADIMTTDTLTAFFQGTVGEVPSFK